MASSSAPLLLVPFFALFTGAFGSRTQVKTMLLDEPAAAGTSRSNAWSPHLRSGEEAIVLFWMAYDKRGGSSSPQWSDNALHQHEARGDLRQAQESSAWGDAQLPGRESRPAAQGAGQHPRARADAQNRDRPLRIVANDSSWGLQEEERYMHTGSARGAQPGGAALARQLGPQAPRSDAGRAPVSRGDVPLPLANGDPHAWGVRAANRPDPGRAPITRGDVPKPVANGDTNAWGVRVATRPDPDRAPMMYRNGDLYKPPQSEGNGLWGPIRQGQKDARMDQWMGDTNSAWGSHEGYQDENLLKPSSAWGGREVWEGHHHHGGSGQELWWAGDSRSPHNFPGGWGEHAHAIGTDLSSSDPTVVRRTEMMSRVVEVVHVVDLFFDLVYARAKDTKPETWDDSRRISYSEFRSFWDVALNADINRDPRHRDPCWSVQDEVMKITFDKYAESGLTDMAQFNVMCLQKHKLRKSMLILMYPSCEFSKNIDGDSDHQPWRPIDREMFKEFLKRVLHGLKHHKELFNYFYGEYETLLLSHAESVGLNIGMLDRSVNAMWQEQSARPRDDSTASMASAQSSPARSGRPSPQQPQRSAGSGSARGNSGSPSSRQRPQTQATPPSRDLSSSSIATSQASATWTGARSSGPSPRGTL